MELKPSKDKLGTRRRVVMDGIGGTVLAEDSRNPWATLARGISPGQGQTGKRRRWTADTLGATPPRDGPFQYGAADVAIQKPPKTRQRRNANAGLGGLFGPIRK